MDAVRPYVYPCQPHYERTRMDRSSQYPSLPLEVLDLYRGGLLSKEEARAILAKCYLELGQLALLKESK